jgi:hypothetical protein
LANNQHLKGFLAFFLYFSWMDASRHQLLRSKLN